LVLGERAGANRLLLRARLPGLAAGMGRRVTGAGAWGKGTRPAACMLVTGPIEALPGGLLDRLPLSAFDVALALRISLAAASEFVEASSRPRWSSSTFGERRRGRAPGRCGR